MASNPMQQFTVHKIGPEIKIAGIDLSFTNASLFMVISASVILLFLFLGSKEKKIIPNKIQLIAEMFYTFVAVNKRGKPVKVPLITPQTDLEKTRYDAALRRRQLSLVLAGKMSPSEATELKAIFD